MENSGSIILADVAEQTENLLSYGSSGIVNHNGKVLQSGCQFVSALLIADIKTKVRAPRCSWDTAKNQAVMDAYLRLFRQP